MGLLLGPLLNLQAGDMLPRVRMSVAPPRFLCIFLLGLWVSRTVYSSLGPGNRVVLGSIIGTEMCGPVIRGTDGCCSSQVLWRMELGLSP